MIPLKQKLIYLASPFSNPSKEIMNNREEVVTAIAAGLTERYGYAMFLPITQSAPMERVNPNLKGDFEQWKSIDLFMIKEKCDELWVVLMEGWRESIGVTAEIKAAEEAMIPVKFYDIYESRFVG